VPRGTVNVVINGYGVIGKRVADAVARQPDMRVVGIADVVGDYRIKMAAAKGHGIYASIPEKAEEMRKAGLEVAGSLEELLSRGAVDVVVDATPEKVGAENRKLYEKHGVKAIFQGGEKHEVAGVSFVAQRNYGEAIGKQFVRVVSCNTTAICRVVGGIHAGLGIRRARVSIFRRAVDVWESSHTGIMNTVVPELRVPSHHGPDAQTVVHSLDIVTMAAKGSHNLFHLHMGMLELNGQATRDEVVSVLGDEPRVVMVNGGDGVRGLNSIFEIARDLGRTRGDLYEIPVWEDALTVSKDGREVYLMWATPNESDVVPENVDAIRAVTGIEERADRSIALTDDRLGIVKRLY